MSYRAPGSGLALAASIIAIIGALLGVGVAYLIYPIATNVTAVSQLAEEMSSIEPILATIPASQLASYLLVYVYIVLASSVVVLALGLFGIPLVYLPASHGDAARAASRALPIGIAYIVFGLFGSNLLFGLIAGILMILAWRSLKRAAAAEPSYY